MQCSNSRVARAESSAKKKEMHADLEFSQTTYTPVKKKLRASFASPPADLSPSSVCFFCDGIIHDEEVVHRAATKNLDSNVRIMATELRDSKLPLICL